MTDLYTYTRKRNELNRPVNLQDTKQVMKIGCVPDPDSEVPINTNLHSVKNPNRIDISNFPVLCENIVNTERVSTFERSIFHYEGGWPKDVDVTDKNEMKKLIKKKYEKNADNADKFLPSVKKMTEAVEAIIAKNNQIDMFEDYFYNEEPEHQVENLNVKTLKLFKTNDDGPKRAVTSLSWHPDGPYKIAAAYSILRFQQNTPSMNMNSYIWDVNNPNIPCNTLTPPSPVVKMVYNHKNPDQIGFGCYNGTVGVWDNRVNKKTPLLVSEIEVSHHEPVVDFIWLSSKGGNEFVTCSTDGKVIWWDYRNISQPTDSLIVSEIAPVNGVSTRNIGATALEYVADYGVNSLA